MTTRPALSKLTVPTHPTLGTKLVGTEREESTPLEDKSLLDTARRRVPAAIRRVNGARGWFKHHRARAELDLHSMPTRMQSEPLMRQKQYNRPPRPLLPPRSSPSHADCCPDCATRASLLRRSTS